MGLPKDLVQRTPTAGLEPGQTDARDLGYPYEFVELVVEGVDQGFSLWDLTRHPQILQFGPTLAGLRKWVGDSGPRSDRAVLDVLHRHDLAKRKASYICPKVPNIKLPLTLPEPEETR
jgi:NH3-dependent NAD+ synthetase